MTNENRIIQQENTMEPYKFLDAHFGTVTEQPMKSIQQAERFARGWNAAESLTGTPRPEATIHLIARPSDGMIHPVQ